MAQGILYEITTDAAAEFNVSASDFYEMDTSWFCGGVRDYDNRTEMILGVTSFAAFLRHMGASVETVNPDKMADKNYAGPIVKIHDITDTVRRAFFFPMFNRAKKAVAELTLDEFSVCQNLIDKICKDLGGWDDDCVMLNGGIRTMSQFVREADPGKTYYIGNALLLW